MPQQDLLIEMGLPQNGLPLFRYAGLQGECVQHTAHITLQRIIDHLVLLHAGLAAETFRDNLGGIMVSVSGKVADRHLCVGIPSRISFSISCASIAMQNLPPFPASSSHFIRS